MFNVDPCTYLTGSYVSAELGLALCRAEGRRDVSLNLSLSLYIYIYIYLSCVYFITNA